MQNNIINIYNKTKFDPNKGRLQKITQDILQQIGLNDIVKIDLTICGEAYIQKLNNKYRKKDKPTDVLSFPINHFFRGKRKKIASPEINNTPTHLGDIVICRSICQKQAKKSDHSTEDEFYHLYQHGLKHLLGFHHREN